MINGEVSLWYELRKLFEIAYDTNQNHVTVWTRQSRNKMDYHEWWSELWKYVFWSVSQQFQNTFAFYIDYCYNIGRSDSTKPTLIWYQFAKKYVHRIKH